MKIKFFTASLPSAAHPEENQDTFFIDKENNTAGVFDGIGGIAGGKEAATWTKKCFESSLVLESLESVFRKCHFLLKEKGEAAFGNQVGTTAALVKIYPHEAEPLVIWGSVGDSRVFRFSSQRLLQISIDDSLIIQALEKGWIDQVKAESIDQAERLKGFNKVESGLFKSRNVITQALGMGIMEPRIGKFTGKEGDLIILTSDGVHGNLTKRQIEEILQKNPKNPAKKLAEAAFQVSQGVSLRATQDDITAVVLKLE